MTAQGLVRAASFVLPLAIAAACVGEEAFNGPLALTSLLDEAAAAENAAGVCECQCACPCDPGRRPFWFAGTEFTFMGVDASTGGRTTLSFDDSGTAGTDLQLAGRDGVQDFAYAPRFWLGRHFGERWGVVGRFWHLEDAQATGGIPVEGTTPLPNFATITDAGRVEMYTIDVEAIRSLRPGKWKIDGTIGARHASMGVDSSLTAFGVFTSGNFVNMTLANGSSFDGTGVTSALVVRRQLGDSRAWLFVSGRGSQMWGQSDSYGRAVGTVAASPSAPLVGAATVRRNNAEADLTIAELQTGIQLEFALRRLPATAFFRTAFEYQNWNLDGLPTGGAGFGGTISDLTTNSFSRAGLGAVHLYGLALATGFTW
jgi:hypothetical protein